jgi:hypothetical protein
VAREAALALHALDHRRLLAADVGTGAATELDPAGRAQAGRLQLRDLAQEDLAHVRVLVA